VDLCTRIANPEERLFNEGILNTRLIHHCLMPRLYLHRLFRICNPKVIKLDFQSI